MTGVLIRRDLETLRDIQGEDAVFLNPFRVV
jgi:hypothetical protein